MNNALTDIIIVIAQTGLLIGTAPLMRGFIRKVKARMQNRVGPPLLQSYFDLAKLFRKESVASFDSSFVFQVAPWVIFGASFAAAVFVPVIFSFSPLGFSSDIILLVYLLALGTFFMALAGLDAGSAFGGMGSSRESMIYSLSEPALLLSLFAAANVAGSTNLNEIVSSFAANPADVFLVSNLFAFCAFFIITIAENKRVPVDNPATHLELTMVHEAMILEYSGRQLALIEWASAVKLAIFLVLLSNVFFPVGLAVDISLAGIFTSVLLLAAKVAALAAVIGVIECSIAKLRLFRVPDFINAAIALSLIALISSFFI